MDFNGTICNIGTISPVRSLCVNRSPDRGRRSGVVQSRHLRLVSLGRVHEDRQVGKSLSDSLMHRGHDLLFDLPLAGTMTELARTFSAEKVNVNVSVVEPDGAMWSISVTPGDGGDGLVQDAGDEHGTRTRS